MSNIINNFLVGIGGPLFSDGSGITLIMFMLGSFLIFKFFKLLWRL